MGSEADGIVVTVTIIMSRSPVFKSFTLALVQLGNIGADKSANLKHAREMIRKAAGRQGKKPDVIVNASARRMARNPVNASNVLISSLYPFFTPLHRCSPHSPGVCSKNIVAVANLAQSIFSFHR